MNEASTTKPGAFNEALGMPRNVDTTSDAPGARPAAIPPYEAAAGGAADSVSKSITDASTQYRGSRAESVGFSAVLERVHCWESCSLSSTDANRCKEI